MSLVLVFTCFFLWSTCFTLGKTTLGFSPPVFLTGVRMALAGAIILAFVAIFQRKEFRIKKHQIFPLVLFAISAVYLTNVLEFWGLQYLTSAKACFIYSLSPFLSALFSYFQFKEKITTRKFLGLIVGFIGFIPYLRSQAGADQLMGGLSFLSWPEMAMIVATATSVYGWILLRKLGKEDGMSPMMANGTSMLLGGIFALIHSGFSDGFSPLPISNYMGFFQGVLLMIVISNLVCYNLYGWLLKRYTATFLSFAGLTTPLFAAFFGWLMLGETVSLAFFVSMGIVALGLWLVYSEELRLGYIVRKGGAPLPEKAA